MEHICSADVAGVARGLLSRRLHESIKVLTYYRLSFLNPFSRGLRKRLTAQQRSMPEQNCPHLQSLQHILSGSKQIFKAMDCTYAERDGFTRPQHLVTAS